MTSPYLPLLRQTLASRALPGSSVEFSPHGRAQAKVSFPLKGLTGALGEVFVSVLNRSQERVVLTVTPRPGYSVGGRGPSAHYIDRAALGAGLKLAADLTNGVQSIKTFLPNLRVESISL